MTISLPYFHVEIGCGLFLQLGRRLEVFSFRIPKHERCFDAWRIRTDDDISIHLQTGTHRLTISLITAPATQVAAS